MLSVFLFFNFLKILFLPAYRSTDFEVHRNWLAITNSLNVSQWYFEDSSEWTLDYPPFFAYFEYLLSLAAKYFDPEMLKIENHNYASFNTVLFQRLSVICTDVVFYIGVMQCLKNVKDHHQKLLYSILLLGNIGLIYVDHIHFQYNGILFGILLLSCGKMMQRKYIQSAIFYSILLNMKHIFIYIAPVYIFHFLKHYCFGNIKKFLVNSFKLGAVVLAITAMSFGPFIHHLPQVLARLFPFKRGLTHAYWAPNFWALYNFLDKILTVILKVPHSASNTGGLVQQHVHSVLPTVTPQITFILTFISMLPCCIKILISKDESTKSFLKPMIICAASSFMFGWHVHEKAILMVLIPLQVLSANYLCQLRTSFFLSVFGLYSLTPLLFTKELIIIKLALYLGYIMYSCVILKRSQSSLNFVEKIYCICMVLLPLYEHMLQYMLNLHQKLPFMPLMLTSVYCGIGMFYFWSKYYLEYLCEKENEIKMKVK